MSSGKKKKAGLLRVTKDYLISKKSLLEGSFELVVGKPADERSLGDLRLAYTVAEGVKSNAIVLVKDGVRSA